MSNFNERLGELIEELDLKNPKEFAIKLGYNKPEKIYRLLREEGAKPSFEIISDIINTFPSVNPTWLLTGQGKMFINPVKQDATVAIIEENSMVSAPLISQYAYAGYLRGFSDSEFLELQPLYVSRLTHKGGSFVAFEVRGDSMDDNTRRSICHGDIVLGRELPPSYWKSKLHIPKVFIIVHKEDGILIKEVIAHNVETGEITCHSWNPSPEYEDFTINLKQVHQLFYIKEISRDNKY